MSSIALCPGSYDPITLGHVDIVQRATTVADHVIIGVAHNAKKNYLFDVDTRVDLARRAAEEAGLENVSVEPVSGLLADYVRERGVSVIIKGLRGSSDFESELTMALLNRTMSGVETMFVLGAQNLNHIASSFVKEIASYGQDVSALVPSAVNDALVNLYKA